MAIFPKIRLELNFTASVPAELANEAGASGRLAVFQNTPLVLRNGTMLRVEKELFDRSPTETARFRSSWIASVGAPSDVDPITAKRQQEYRRQGRQFRRRSGYRGVNVWKGKSKSKLPFVLANNVPYATRIANGWSDQAPPGWVDSAIRRGVKLGSFASIRNFVRRRLRV